MENQFKPNYMDTSYTSPIHNTFLQKFTIFQDDIPSLHEVMKMQILQQKLPNWRNVHSKELKSSHQ